MLKDPATKRIVLEDNLNTHKPASLYEAFPEAETRPLAQYGRSRAQRVSGQCLDRRIPKRLVVREFPLDPDRHREREHTSRLEKTP
jgi:hypothetical protein